MFIDPTTGITHESNPNAMLAAMYSVQAGLMARMVTAKEGAAMWERVLVAAQKAGVSKALIAAWLGNAMHVEGFPLPSAPTGG